jgi:hypothetical protein
VAYLPRSAGRDADSCVFNDGKSPRPERFAHETLNEYEVDSSS